jgi:hypothetical protein
MKPGDLIRYRVPDEGEHTGIILELMLNGDCVNVLWQDGKVEEVDAEYCEVINENR